MDVLVPDSAETQRLLERIVAGESSAAGRLLERHRPYVTRLVELRLDARVRARVDPSDVVQEAQLEAIRRLPTYMSERPLPFRLWLRQIAFDRLLMLHRRHVRAARRAVERDLPLPEKSSILLARQFLVPGSTPSRQLIRREFVDRVRQAIGMLNPADREVLVLRNLEELSNRETARVLGIDPATASRRYGRAVLHLREILLQSGLLESEL
jgi:RNA polymerase sigma-70 factor (ECF subfamily)